MRTESRRHRLPPILAILLATVFASGANAQVAAQQSFPPVAPEQVGMSSEALAELAAVVAGYVDRDMAVGAELLVIKDGHTVLHEAYGWRDREAGIPMEQDTLFNIRSMTKPITGAAAQILIDEGRLALDDRASDYLPGFDTDEARDITVEQLLTHRSGLPLTTLTGTRDYDSLEAMANAIGAGGPQFAPGSKFWYSDAGADVLGAIVEQASGSPLADFVSERLLQPLGMDDTFYGGDPEEPRLERVASLYVGGFANWNRFWGPADEPFYPYAWGSQSLYSTPLDYARFLDMWLHDGMAGATRVLSPQAVERTLTPTAAMASLGSDAPYPTRYDGLTAYHGQMAVLHVDGDPVDGQPPPGAEPTVIGYSGSDGTIAWAWPERDLMILYFTQSRGGATAIRLEDDIERLLLDPPADGGAEMPDRYAALVGTYTADFGPFRNEPFEVLWRDGRLLLDIPSQFVYALERDGDDDHWRLRDDPGVAISFERDAAAEVTGLRLGQAAGSELLPKGAPPAGAEVELTLEDVERFLGWFRDTQTGREVEVVFEAGQLALRIPESSEPLGLFPPGADGGWRVRLDPSVSISFDEEDGVIVSYTARSPLGEATFEKVITPDPGPADR